MKKIYLFLTFLLTLVGGFFSPALAQDEDPITIEVKKGTGDWLYANAARTWASQWQSSGTPQVLIRQTSSANNGHGDNNMAYVGDYIEFFNGLAGTGNTCEYKISVAGGYEIMAVSLDFVGSHADKGIYVEFDGEKSAENNSTTEYVHFESEDFSSTEITFIVGATSTNIFAITKNFKITVQKMAGLLVAIKELQAVMDQYRDYTVLEGDAAKQFVVGPEPGNYDADAVEAFNTAFQACNDIEDMEEPTVEIVNGLKDALVAAYQAVIDSKVTTMTLEDGYYRFRTGMKYNDGTVKYMYVNSADGTFAGCWGTIENLDTDCSSLFKVTNAEDGTFDIVSMSTDARFNENPATLSLESTNLYVMEPVVTAALEEGDPVMTYVNIRLSGTEAGSQNYIHQASHSSGKGTGSNLTKWYPTAAGYQMGASEWAIDPVDAATAEAIIAANEDAKAHAQLLAAFKPLLAEAAQAVKDAKDIQEYTELIEDGTQFSSPWTSTAEGVGKESYGWGGLLDGVNTTYWHSDWSSNVPNHTHWLEVALNEPVHDLIQMKITRRPVQNDHITLWGVFGSNEQDVPAVLYTAEDEEVINGDKQVGDVKVEGKEAEWTELASLSTPFGNNTETLTSKEFDTQGFQYLRFYIDGTTTGRGYGHVSEFHLVIPVPNEKSQYAYMGDVATNLDALLKELEKLSDEEIAQENYDALLEAYDAFKAQFVDPTELRELLASVEGVANGIEVGTNPGYWPDATTGDALKDTYDEAMAYDEAGVYAAAKTDEYIKTLKAQVEAVKAAVITIQEGKWYRFHFGSRETFEAHEWDLENNDDAVTATTEGDVVTSEALWDKYVTAAILNQDEVDVLIPAKEEGQDPTAKKLTIYTIEPYDEETAQAIRMGEGLYWDADENIILSDLSLFRFVGVGDSAYVIQNKGTGMFLKAAGGTGAVTLSIQPSLFNVDALGYGQNLISASNLITDAKQNYLHAQRNGNTLVTYSEKVAGSRSGFYIDEAGDVESDYDGSAFQMDLKPGSLNSFCYPVGIAAPDDMELYDVVGVDVEEGVIQLNAIEEAVPGRPFIFIYEGDYVAEPLEDDSEPVTFYHDCSFTKEAIAAPFLKGTYSTISLPKGALMTYGNGFVIGDSDVMSSYRVVANGAYIQGEEQFPLTLDYTYDIVEVEDGIAATLQRVAKSGELYTIDGRLLSRKANLNDLKRYGKGIYILNGVKVTVK